PKQAGQRWQEGSLTLEYVPLGPPWPFFSQMATAWRLVRRALSWQPHVIHCFKPKGYAGLAAFALWHLRRLRLTDARLVVDEDDWEGTGGWNELEPYPALLRRFFAWQERWGLTHCDAVTVASRTLQSLVWALGVPAKRVFYLPNGVAAWSEAVCERSNDGSPVRQKYHLRARPVVLLYTRFFEYDVARVVDTLRAIAAQEPEVRFLVVGRGLFAQDDRRFDELIR
ncbi:MAG: glycosyltransferase, partial [Clostridia bacterium]|nr:glycosyltransferase [Clostridia bacterium]